MIILGIDTSCDETSVGITSDTLVLSNIISSQVRYHKKFGGVVPFLAQRLHKERIDNVVALALERAKLNWKDIEAIAVTYGPGLAPALEVGLQKAKDLRIAHQKPLYGINHMAGHIASCFAQVGGNFQNISFPLIALLVSGGHTELVYTEQFGEWKLLGQTLDDAVGEAYDKVAKMLGLGYPGGKLVAKFAKLGNAYKYELPVPMLKSNDLNFSYSGLKNAVRLLILEVKDNTHSHQLEAQEIYDICAVFERVAHASLIHKLEKSLESYPNVKSVILAGGVAANTILRTQVRLVCKKKGIVLRVPANLKLCTDNAAMICVAAYLGIRSGLKPISVEELDRNPGLKL